MKKIISVLLVMALTLGLTACGLKEAVQDKTRELLGSVTGQVDSPGGTGDSVAGTGNTDDAGASDGSKRPIASAASPGGYWDRLAAEWENSPEEGYVWTITFDGTETLDVMGLAVVNYTLKLSCSHVGMDMFGPYKGEMEMSYNADLSGMVELITLTGGSVDYDADGWFKNDAFIMELYENDAQAEEIFIESFQSVADEDMDEATAALVQGYMDDLLGDIGSGDRDFELSQIPAGNWFDWDFHMTEGDMSGFITMSGIAYGTTSGSGGVDASGVYASGHAENILGYSERYSETIETPFPYVIRLYETGEAVFELYSANGGPVTVKFYGTVDKIPVEETTLVRP
jgi:hypothetical protein